MNLTIEKQELTRLLNIVGSVIDRNPSLPVLANILFTAHDGALTITASNGDVSTQTQTTNLNVIEDGTILIDGATIISAVQKLDGTLTLQNKNNQIKISNSKANYKLNTTEPTSYPSVDFTRSDTEFKVNGNHFTMALNKVVNSVAVSAERPVFQGVNMKASGNELVFTATDSYRLSKSYLEVDDIEFDITVLGTTLKSISKAFRDKELTVSVGTRNVVFLTDDTVFTTRLVDGLFPDTTRLVPTSFNKQFKVKRDDLMKSVDRASFMKEDNIWILRLSTKGDILEITTKAQDIGTTHETLSIETQGDDMAINLNGKYLLNALNVLEDDLVEFNLVGELQALTVSDTTEQVQLLLPIRTY